MILQLSIFGDLLNF